MEYEDIQQRWVRTKLPQLLIKIKKFSPRIYEVITANNFKHLSSVKSSYLSGTIGSGKTTQAAWMMLEWARLRNIARLHDLSCEIITVPQMLRNMKEGIRTNTDYEILEKYQNTNLLILDDLGAEKMSDWVYEQLYLLITYRYSRMKTTIYTSNKSIQELSIHFGDERISSRINHECKGNINVYKNKPRR